MKFMLEFLQKRFHSTFIPDRISRSQEDIPMAIVTSTAGDLSAGIKCDCSLFAEFFFLPEPSCLIIQRILSTDVQCYDIIGFLTEEEGVFREPRRHLLVNPPIFHPSLHSIWGTRRDRIDWNLRPSSAGNSRGVPVLDFTSAESAILPVDVISCTPCHQTTIVGAIESIF